MTGNDARAAADACCDPELARLLLDLAELADVARGVTPARCVYCAACETRIDSVGDRYARRGLCQRCYDAERARRRRGRVTEAAQ